MTPQEDVGDPYRAPGVLSEAESEPEPEREPRAESPVVPPAPMAGKAVGKVRLIDRSVTLKPPRELADHRLVVAFILASESDVVETRYSEDRLLRGREKQGRRFVSTPRHERARGACLFLLLTNQGEVRVDPRDGFTFVGELPLLREHVTKLGKAVGRAAPAEVERLIDDLDQEYLRARKSADFDRRVSLDPTVIAERYVEGAIADAIFGEGTGNRLRRDSERDEERRLKAAITVPHLLHSRVYGLVVKPDVRLEVSGMERAPDPKAAAPFPTLGNPNLVFRAVV